ANLVATRQLVEHAARERVLLIHPLLHPGIVGILEPAIGIGDLDAVQRVSCLFDTSRRIVRFLVRRSGGHGGETQEKEREGARRHGGLPQKIESNYFPSSTSRTVLRKSSGANGLRSTGRRASKIP